MSAPWRKASAKLCREEKYFFLLSGEMAWWWWCGSIPSGHFCENNPEASHEGFWNFGPKIDQILTEEFSKTN